MRVGIIYDRFINAETMTLYVGGAENYIWNLSKICRELGLDTLVYQTSAAQFHVNFHHVEVKGLVPRSRKRRHYLSQLHDAAMEELDPRTDILIFASEFSSVQTKFPRSISIQHGIFWDQPSDMLIPNRMFSIPPLPYLWKAYSAIKAVRYFRNARYKVCVDYNYLNWYRTIVPNAAQDGTVKVIPNFSPIADASFAKPRNDPDGNVKILFARRFIKCRGTRLMADVTKRLLQNYSNVFFTYAGEGDDLEWLKNQFHNNKQVEFKCYHPDDAQEIVIAHDISVVPSLASEGTSLAVAEAMAAGRAVVATNVGGITNMIIDRFNGLLINPDPDELYDALVTLIENSSFRNELAAAGYCTAVKAFSFEKWKEEWTRFLLHVGQSDL